MIAATRGDPVALARLAFPALPASVRYLPGLRALVVYAFDKVETALPLAGSPRAQQAAQEAAPHLVRTG